MSEVPDRWKGTERDAALLRRILLQKRQGDILLENAPEARGVSETYDSTTYLQLSIQQPKTTASKLLTLQVAKLFLLAPYCVFA